jgi:hypothetical protein
MDKMDRLKLEHIKDKIKLIRGNPWSTKVEDRLSEILLDITEVINSMLEEK